MPIYEYQCQQCEHQFDTLQNLSDKPLRKCPECGKLKLTKLISAAGFRLKGAGWYETDFKSGSKKNLAGDNKSGAGGSESSSSGGSDSKSSSSSDASTKAKAKPKGKAAGAGKTAKSSKKSS